MRPAEFQGKWNAEAEAMRQRGVLANGALLLAEVLRDFEAVMSAQREELLTLSQAASESGYSVDHLGALIRRGTLPNCGRPHAPRVRRGDLPRKISRLPSPALGAKLVGATPRQVARAIVTSQEA